MPKKKSPSPSKSAVPKDGETHQQATSEGAVLITNQGLPIADNQNSLKAGGRGLAAKADARGRVGITNLNATKDIGVFIDFARKGKVWEREPEKTPAAGRARSTK